jgi:putative tricarboxylic transport membrane protein
MFEALIEGLALVLQWKAFSLMLLGMGLGFCVGLLPGIGGAATLALMIPFVFKMTPAEAFAFLLGMHSVAATTGDITSILFGVPGEGLSAATVVDGYPMAKNGEAGRALGAALMSSLVGALIGAVALALAIPVVRPLVLTFGSPELFFLSMIGIACITSLSGLGLRGQIRGFAMGLFGLLLSTIGQERQSGSLRFDMGLMYLWEGLDLVPVLVGIFAIPELVDLAVRGTSFLARGSLFRGGRFRRCDARSRRRCGAVDGLRSRSAEREGFQGSGTLRQRRCARRARAGSGEQL